MSENLKNSKDLERIAKITFVSILLIFSSRIIYSLGHYVDNVMILSLILAIIGVVIFIISLIGLVKRRKEPRAKHIIKGSLVGFILAILYFFTIYM